MIVRLCALSTPYCVPSAMLRYPTLCFVQGERRFYLGAVSDDLFLATVSSSCILYAF